MIVHRTSLADIAVDINVLLGISHTAVCGGPEFGGKGREEEKGRKNYRFLTIYSMRTGI